MKFLNWKTATVTVGALAAAAIVLPLAMAGGPKGPQSEQYGIAQVNVARNGGDPSTWATYSTTLGSPAGDTASGTFRLTCSSAPCSVSLKAYSTESGVTMYPRVLIFKQSLSGGPETYCEYGDGTNNNGGVATLTMVPETVTLGIGGSLDCGSTQSYPANGIVTEIDVPVGHYDVMTTLTFFAPGT